MIREETMRSAESWFNAACVDLNNYLGETPWYFSVAWPVYKLPSGKVVELRASIYPDKKVTLHFGGPWPEEWLRASVARKLEVIENWPKILEAFEDAQSKEYKRLSEAVDAVDTYTGRQELKFSDLAGYDLLTEKEAKERVRDVEHFYALRKQGALLQQGPFYPAWQFRGGTVLPGFQGVLAALLGLSNRLTRRFFYTPSPQLSGEQPFRVLCNGDVDAVLHAAQAWAKERDHDQAVTASKETR